MRYELTSDLITGNSLIDSEHKQLFEAVNQLLDAFSDKGTEGRSQIDQAATFLRNYVNKHFGHEEDLQKRYEWREFDTHVRFHEEYKKTLMSELNVHIVRLITHIRTMDKRLGAYLQSKGEK